LHTVDVTLSLASREEQTPPTPPPGANGPIRAPIQVVDQDASVGRESSARFTANVAGTDETALRVSALPATGTGSQVGGAASSLFTLGLALAMLVFAHLTRRRAA
ncbi:MAG: hypothetical protein WKF63_03465, partial [Thermomicrobiales bacterium]